MLQVKSDESNGYAALQLGFGRLRHFACSCFELRDDVLFFDHTSEIRKHLLPTRPVGDTPLEARDARLHVLHISTADELALFEQGPLIRADGSRKRPVAIHRAIFGSFERFIGVITEHFAGAFPTWLAPVQARVLPLSEKFIDYARTVHQALRAARIRAELDDRNEKLGYRIREAQLRKVPYMLVCGAREAESGTVSLRHRTGDDIGPVPVDRLLTDLTREIASRDASLTVGRS